VKLRKLWLYLRLLWDGVCPRHGKVIEFGDTGCEVCKQQSLYRRVRGAHATLSELRAMNGGRHG
jgi:hypothetical protein